MIGYESPFHRATFKIVQSLWNQAQSQQVEDEVSKIGQAFQVIAQGKIRAADY